ncbi:MAG: PPOX class F420-dependent oxidoreductase [Promethearchaeota archaeon]
MVDNETGKILAQLKDSKHINIITFRKNGEGAATPVWFLEDKDKYYVCTGGETYKVKRIRNNPEVQIAQSDASGNLMGQYFEGKAKILAKNEVDPIYSLFRKKYSGFRMWNFFANLGKKEEKKHVYLEITLK